MAKVQGGKNRKYGRNKRPVDAKMSAYVRGKISFEEYNKGRKS